MVKSNHLNRKSTSKPSQLLPNQSWRWKSQESCYWLIAGPPPHFGPIIWLTELPVPLAVAMETVATASVIQWSHHLGKTALKPRLLHKPQNVTGCEKKKKGDKSELGRILISEGILLDSRKLDFQILNGSRVLFYVFNWIQISDMLKVGMGNYDFYICCVNGW